MLVDEDHEQALAWVQVAEGKHDEAVAALRPMADKEDSLGEEPAGQSRPARCSREILMHGEASRAGAGGI